jgi:hypothetical protein
MRIHQLKIHLQDIAHKRGQFFYLVLGQMRVNNFNGAVLACYSQLPYFIAVVKSA